MICHPDWSAAEWKNLLFVGICTLLRVANFKKPDIRPLSAACKAAQHRKPLRYLFPTRPSANLSAVLKAFAALTFTSGSTPTPSQSVFENGLTALTSGTPIPK